MPNRSPDELFQLIQTLEKAEKRNFKLFVRRNASSEELKIIQLFDAMERMEHYDEEYLLRRHPEIRKAQLSNLKAHLYRQILASLRILRDEDNIDIRLHEQFDQARILYNKGLYQQSLKILSRIKELAKTYHQITYWLQALVFEKKIESLHITRSFEDRAEQLSKEVEELDERLVLIGKLSNLALRLYGWYIRTGLTRDPEEEQSVKTFFDAHMPQGAAQCEGFYERLYYHQCMTWFAFIRQDLLLYYKSCQRWADVFRKEPGMLRVEAPQYIKGMHNLLHAHFMLRNRERFLECLSEFESFHFSDIAQSNLNLRVQSFVYLYIAKINRHFMEGTFTEGLALVPEIEERIGLYEQQLDRHRVLVFYYKIACLYFGSGDCDRTIEYLNRIIHWKADLRADVQCYARLLHLIAHYELGNYEILESLIKSVYRFMVRMKNLSVVEQAVLEFLQRSFHKDPRQLKPDFEALRERLLPFEHDAHERRSFMYLDFISWLESRIRAVPVQQIIRERFLAAQRRLHSGH
jgi:tetratricopeptide (TPR) repeat protein